MDKIEIAAYTLIGLTLKTKTFNQNGQSAIDCGNLWQQFEKENIADTIPDKLNPSEIIAVYHNYEGDHTQPYSYFIGCKVPPGTKAPEGLQSLNIPAGKYIKLMAKGVMPACVADTWKKIWKSDISRAYQPDFEVYDDRSKDWNHAEVDVYISVP